MSAPWLKFFCADWRADPRLRMCSLAARGLWIDLMSYMHEGEPYGHLTIDGRAPDIDGISALVARPRSEVRKAIADLEANNVFSRTETGVIFSRRMVRDKAKADKDRENGKNGGHPDIKRGTVPKEQRVRRFRRSDSPAKAQRIFDRSAGACHWCQKPLDPNGYHIDHVVAIRDGGTNDEANLVASCPDCNGERAMASGRSDTDLMVGKDTDHKAQIPEARIQNPESEFPSLRSPDDGSGKYAFESGVIRLNKKDFESWVKAYTHLDLRAELLSLAPWAAEQGSWFHAVQCALAKRNRDQKLKLEQVRERGPQRGIAGII